MDDHVRVCEEMFSAARTEFKHLEYFYFHNFVYESMWKDNRRRHTEKIPIGEITHKYGPDYKLVLVGDATMSPYEIVYAGGSVEHWNEEPGAVLDQATAKCLSESGLVQSGATAALGLHAVGEVDP